VIDDLLSRLDKVRPAGDRAWIACCPSHDDREPSLSIAEGDTSVVMHCHAGCSTKEILDSVSLTWGELFPDNGYRKTDTADYAKQLWDAAQEDVVRFHPYAQKKKITHDFGARRCRATGRLIGKDVDCIVIPMRSWDGDLVGVECINWEGVKQTFGSKGQLILGYPEGAEWVHCTEGWASLWGVAQMRPKSFAGVVVFGKSRLERERGLQLDKEIENRFGATAVRHTELGKEDAWDHWDAGNGEKYLGGNFK
jgi:hypothetical protein